MKDYLLFSVYCYFLIQKGGWASQACTCDFWVASPEKYLNGFFSLRELLFKQLEMKIWGTAGACQPGLNAREAMEPITPSAITQHMVVGWFTDADPTWPNIL